MKILFDATVLAEGLKKTSNRSGIYQVASRVFLGLSARGDIELTVYARPSLVDDVNEWLRLNLAAAGYRVANRERSCLPGRARRFAERRRELAGGMLMVQFWRTAGIAARILARFCDRFTGLRRTIDLVNRCDAFFSPVYIAPVAIRRHSRVPRFVILYDAIPMLFPDFYAHVRGEMWTSALARNLTDRDYGFAISNCTKRDFLKFSPSLRDANVTVVYPAASEMFYQCADEDRIRRVLRRYNLPAGRRYFLSLCTIEPRKNLGTALKAFARVAEEDREIVFVLAGSKWAVYDGRWRRLLGEVAEVGDRIFLPGYIDDEDLAPLYSGALAFVYPSIYEGFGLPPLEAMQCGCPVVTSDTSSLPEVVGEAGLMVAPGDVEGLAEAMRKLSGDEAFRGKLRQKGLERAKRFGWDRTVDAIVGKMTEVAGGA